MNIEQYKELRARFKKHFPDACFFANNPDEQDIKELCTFDNGELVINPLDDEFIISDILPICGCGFHEEVAKIFYKTLAWCWCHDDKGELVHGNPVWMPGWDDNHDDAARLLQCTILYWLDVLKFTEHGGSVYGSWLTEKGKCARDVLRVALHIKEGAEA